jgi:transposase
MDLTDDQWAVIQPLIPDPPRRPDGKGRPWKDSRDIMNGILLWILLRTGAPWYGMPDRYVPPHRTKHAIVEGFSNGYVLVYLNRFFIYWQQIYMNAED